MNITLSGERKSDYHKITIGEEWFEVGVSAPTFADKLKDTESASSKTNDGAWIEHRIRSTITGFRNLFDEAGDDVKFSWVNLAALCEQSSEAYYQILNLAHRAYQGLSETKQKN